MMQLLPFDKQEISWYSTQEHRRRNNITPKSSEKLTALFYQFLNVVECAHLYQALLNKEPHLSEIDYITTLSGYVHWQLTENKSFRNWRRLVCSR